jgi:hypothetical protein
MPKLIKTVKGKEFEIEADESQIETLLKDKRFRLAEENKPIVAVDLNDEEVKARIDEIVSKGFSFEYAVKVVSEK